MDLSPSASEASKLLEAALEQMDGIIQGAKFEIPAKAANNPVSEALRNLHTCLLREDASASTLASVEPESIEFVFNWLRNNLMFDPVQSQDADLLEQVDRQVVRIRELEQLIHAKSEMLRQMESALERERNSNEPMIRLQADLAQLKTKNQMLEKENNELRRLCGGDRTPKYLPIAAPSPRNSDSDQSPATEEAGIPLAAKSSSASKSPNKSFRKIFGKVKRSNSGGQLTGQEITPPPPDKYGDLKICLDQKGSIDYRIEEITPKSQPFRRGGFRATAGGRLGWSTKPEAGGSQVLSKKPFEDWSLDVIGVWMDSLGLGMYNTDLKKHILVGSHLLKMTSNDLEAKLNMKSAMHRKKLSLALKAKNKAKISPPLPPDEDSSSECNSAFDETASIASSTASRKRKHKNPTGFPSPKKKKSKQKPIDLPVKKHSPQSKKQSSPQSSPVTSLKGTKARKGSNMRRTHPIVPLY